MLTSPSLPELKDEEQRKKFEALRRELNALPQIDYERVNQAKNEYLRLVYEQEGKQIMGSEDFKQFFADTEQWLVPYAQYSSLRDKFGTADFSQWPDHRVWDETERKTLTTPRNKAYKEVEYWYFVQYVLSTQLHAVHKYARQHHVILKGDIPIGVNRYSCDVWMEPKYFNLNGQAGAPPDDFSVNGQNWGFPTYNWEEMIKDGCQWWVRRFQNMAKFFDAYRIDHVLGFFRIWEIPVDAVHGLLGQFQPALGMSREEIEGYGLHFLEDQFCKPFIADWVLDRVFGTRAEEVKTKYLVHSHDDIWEMKPEYDTQRKVEQAFAGVTNQDELNLRDGLYALISDVLFLRDSKDPNKFHPRISAQFDFTYEALYDIDKAAFNRLYNDYFYRRNNQFWYREAMKKLPKLVQATRMLVCAEDLGMVPDCVPWVINELRILSLEIQSMPKDPHVRFGHLSRNPYRSVCTFSTHDMATLRQWWDENYERTQDYYNSMLYREGPAPHPLPEWLARDIISRQLTSPSMLCVLSIQDWLAMYERLRLADADAERINIPANPRHYWRYRMHLNIEDLAADKAFMHNIKELLYQSGRG
jgi:4-alpha-glucanotransferase